MILQFALYVAYIAMIIAGIDLLTCLSSESRRPKPQTHTDATLAILSSLESTNNDF